jgi:hypothetical protein
MGWGGKEGQVHCSYEQTVRSRRRRRLRRGGGGGGRGGGGGGNCVRVCLEQIVRCKRGVYSTRKGATSAGECGPGRRAQSTQGSHSGAYTRPLFGST